jgi:membrane-bound inhibitor of C-type lysozyme
MAEISASREILNQEDVAYKRSVSEAILSRFGATNNFIVKYQYDTKIFQLNGRYVSSGVNFGIDGAYTFWFKGEIVGISVYSGVVGSSGTTEIDFESFSASNVSQGSIFSTTPKVNSGSSNNSNLWTNFETGNSYTPAGFIMPVFSKTTFLEGEYFILKLLSNMQSAENLSVCVFIRPIT